ncbi:hypothetical protein B0T24DRAFT_672703 [Lasiosphaeria ovina]|uniref:Uncharacterized protein n=1 Tax=Lasiosphaeria ovina TaxID=92902 RepID=A0AAE0NJK9_9PEZI|nr:hypothetical protein B0T24DRAFT_672703 [Lasiosphaeria ovina]
MRVCEGLEGGLNRNSISAHSLFGGDIKEADPDSFDNWEKLVRAWEGLEGGLNRNSIFGGDMMEDYDTI